MGSPDDEILFVCWPPSLAGQGVPGSVIRHCRTCLGEIWVAQSTLKEIKKRRIRNPNYCCVPCVHRKARAAEKTGERVQLMAPTEEQIEELEADIRRRRH